MPSAQGKNMFADASVETTSGFDAAVMTGKTPDELLGVYAGWAEAYDAEMDKIGWQTPKNVAQVLKDVVNPPKDARILDVAAGTGLICKFLHEFGYTNFDALDPSEEMLQVAKSRNIFTNFFVSFIGGGTEAQFDKGAYDVVVMSGAFVDGHCPVDAWDDMIDAIKPGGYVVCSMTEKYLDEVPEFFKMEEYIEDVMKRKNAILVERRVLEKSLLGKESIIVWVVRKQE